MIKMPAFFHRITKAHKCSNTPVHCYFFLSIGSILFAFLIPPLGVLLCYFYGSNTVIWTPLLLCSLAIDWGINFLRIGAIVLLFTYPVILLVAYILAVCRKMYLPLTVTAFSDVVISFTVGISCMFNMRHNFPALLLFLGIVPNLCFSLYFLSMYKYRKSQQNQTEMT